VINSGRRIDLPLSGPILIGRQDAARGHFPELDLNHDGGYDSGVSRRHARLSVEENVTYIEDLDSANGSFINDMRLQPHTAYRLQVGDELRLGSLILRIEKI
jgi:pSer/pThr/pTyr-binding forkhead associated (FHA) protein